MAIKYKDVDENSELMEWTIDAIRTEDKNGVKIPVELAVKWKLEDGDWTWLKLKITNINYNLIGM